MYFYIYDSFLNDKKFLNEIHAVESRLMSLGINGKSEKITLLKSFREIVFDAVKKGADTIVAVGNDETISKIINFLPNLSVTLGIIPFGPNNTIATILGIPQGVEACEVLSSRIIEHIDVGKANDCYFISSLAVPVQKDLVLDCGPYQISSESDQNMITICNFGTQKFGHRSHYCNPHDGVLEAVFSNSRNQGGWQFFRKNVYHADSVFPFTKIKIKCAAECLPVIADGQTTIKTPVTVEVVPKKLKLIVGKKRLF